MGHIFDIQIPQENDQAYNPWLSVQRGSVVTFKLIQPPAVGYLAARGFIYDNIGKQWYRLDPDSCTYSPVDDYAPEGELVDIAMRFRPSQSCDITSLYLNTVLRLAKKRNPAALKAEVDSKGPLRMYRDMTDKYITGCGIVDIRRKTLLPNCRYVFDPSRTLSVDYTHLSDEEIASHPAKEIYDNIFCNEDSLNYYLWFIGQTLFSDHPAKAIFTIIGVSNSGKSALMKPVHAILKGRSADLDVDIFNTPFGSSLVRKGRLAVFNEADGDNSTDQKKLTSLFKRMTGGEGMVFNQKNVKMEFDKSTANIILLCNRYPDLYVSDAGLVERLRVINLMKDQNEIYGAPILHNIITSPENINWLFNAAAKKWLEYGESGDGILSKKLPGGAKRDMLETSPFMKWGFDYGERHTESDDITIDDIRSALSRKRRKDVYEDYLSFINNSDDYAHSPLSNQRFYNMVMCTFKLSVMKSHGYDIFV